jgi:hypothetical protein
MPVPAAWRDYQLREWTAFAAFGFAIVSGVFAWSGLVSPDLAVLAKSALYASPVAVVIALGRLVAFRCPRCGHTYSVRVGPGQFPDRKPSARNCLHCWLPKWADPARLPAEAVLDENDDW